MSAAWRSWAVVSASRWRWSRPFSRAGSRCRAPACARPFRRAISRWPSGFSGVASRFRRVRPGRRLGRVLGFPTANLPLGRRRYACEGIHAVRVDGEGLQRWPGVASIGQRPTVGGGETWLEVHLFDFAGDLYGKQLRVEFCARLREERRFPSLEAMIEEMRHDAERARAALAA